MECLYVCSYHKQAYFQALRADILALAVPTDAHLLYLLYISCMWCEWSLCILLQWLSLSHLANSGVLFFILRLLTDVTLLLFWACCLFIFRNLSFLFYLIYFLFLFGLLLSSSEQWAQPYLFNSEHSELINLLPFKICRHASYCGITSITGEFEFSIDYLNGLLFEPMALWSLLHLSIKTALFVAIISARKTGDILAFSGAKISGQGYFLNF